MECKKKRRLQAWEQKNKEIIAILYFGSGGVCKFSRNRAQLWLSQYSYFSRETGDETITMYHGKCYNWCSVELERRSVHYPWGKWEEKVSANSSQMVWWLGRFLKNEHKVLRQRTACAKAGKIITCRGLKTLHLGGMVKCREITRERWAGNSWRAI